jgi:hypothetical protein
MTNDLPLELNYLEAGSIGKRKTESGKGSLTGHWLVDRHCTVILDWTGFWASLLIHSFSKHNI